MPFNKRKLLYLIFPLMVIGTAALLHSHVKKVEESPAMAESPWAIATDVVRTGSVNRGFPALGKVVSSTEVRIVPQISGTVLEMGPREGGEVHKGEMIVHLDTRQLESDADAIRAKLASAVAIKQNDSNELQREQRLLKEGGSSASAVERYQTRVRSDRANVRTLKKQLQSMQVSISYGHIKAPISGHIARRLAEPGDAVFPGKSVYTLTANQGGRVVVPVPLDTVTRIKVGGKVELSLGAQQVTVPITRINPSLDTLSMGSLEIDLPARPFNLPDGAPIAAHVLTDAAGPGLSVSVDALRPAVKQAQRIVFKVVAPNEKHPKLKQIPVQVQLCGKARCVVEGDLHAGDRVVTAHGSVLLQLHDGDPLMNNWTPAVTAAKP